MIDLEKIIDSQITWDADLQSREEIKDCIKAGIEQALDMANENAWKLPRTPDEIKRRILDVKNKIKE